MGGAWIKSCILGQSRQRRGFSTIWKGEEGGSASSASSAVWFPRAVLSTTYVFLPAEGVLLA